MTKEYNHSEIEEFVRERKLFHYDDEAAKKLSDMAKMYCEYTGAPHDWLRQWMEEQSFEMANESEGLENLQLVDFIPRVDQKYEARSAEVKEELFQKFVNDFDIQDHLDCNGNNGD